MPSLPLGGELREVVLRMCEDVGSLQALKVSILLRFEEWDQLAELRCVPGHYSCASAYYRDVAVTDFLRKLEDLPTSFDRAAKARENFWRSERMCFRTNELLSPFLFGAQGAGGEVAERLISTARKKISDILGPAPSLVEGRFGPGATYADRGQLTTVPDKMSSRPTLTPDAIPWLFPWTGTLWAKACAVRDKSPEVVRGNRFTTVPKDCTKHRGIAVEPSINLFYQLGLGRVMKRRLHSAGIDLKNAQEIHKRVACEASIRGHFATIDLSNASDTVARNLVKLLVPHRWYEQLDSLRSPTTLIDGKTLWLEKFSSMGNGFTFELETCLFLGICCAVMEQLGHEPLPGVNVFVFGDDIIVPTECARGVIAALRFLGFEENANKTFLDGPFRESCGGDYFDGVDVRPFYLKESPREPNEWIALANGLYRLGRPDHNGHFYHKFPHRARLRVLDAIPSRIRSCRGPQGLGDLVIHDNEGRGTARWRSGIRYWKVWRPARYRRVSWAHFVPDVTLASAVYGVGDGRLGVTPRDAVLGYKVGWVPLS